MKHILITVMFSLLSEAAVANDNGIISKSSKYAVPETINRLESVVKARGGTVFALIDQSGAAEKIGLEMRPTQLLLFGNRKITPLMNSSPSVAIDFPAKALVWQDENGKVWVSYNSPAYSKQSHELMSSLVIDGVIDHALQ